MELETTNFKEVKYCVMQSIYMYKILHHKFYQSAVREYMTLTNYVIHLLVSANVILYVTTRVSLMLSAWSLNLLSPHGNHMKRPIVT